MKSAVGLQGWKDGVEGRCCYGCGANCTTHPWTDPSLGAAWRATMYTRQSFVSHLMFGAIATTGIWSWPGFTINMCEWDWMHAADLGATPVTLGNVYEELFLFLGGTRKHPLEACGKLLDMIKIASKELNMNQPPIYHLEYTVHPDPSIPRQCAKIEGQGC